MSQITCSACTKTFRLKGTGAAYHASWTGHTLIVPKGRTLPKVVAGKVVATATAKQCRSVRNGVRCLLNTGHTGKRHQRVTTVRTVKAAASRRLVAAPTGRTSTRRYVESGSPVMAQTRFWL